MSTHMGLGLLGDPNIVFRRKFRYTISGNFPSGVLPESFVKISSRPSLDQAGEITTTFYETDKAQSIYELIVAQCMLPPFEYTKTNNYWLKKRQNKRFGDITLKMYDGCGVILEEWHCDGVTVRSVNFGDLDYSSSETTVEIDWKYKSCSYKNIIPEFAPTYPNIYGFKTPEKHMIKMVDGVSQSSTSA